MKLNKRVRKRKIRGLSPIIADILLIGLVVVAGAATFTTVMVIVNTKEPIVVTIRNVDDFKLSNINTPSTKYNTFSILIENSGTRDIGILNSSISIFNASDLTFLSSWIMSGDQEIPSKLSKNIVMRSTSASESDWLSVNDTILIKASVYALDTDYTFADKTNVSLSFKVSSSSVEYGPIIIQTNSSQLTSAPALNISDNRNNSLEIAVLNYGVLPVNYTIEFLVSNRSLNFSLHYVNNANFIQSYITNLLQGAIGSTPTSTSNLTPNQTIILTVSNKTFINPGVDEFVLTVRLKIKTKIFDTLQIICKS